MERLSLAAPYNATEFAIHALRYLPLRGNLKGKRVLDIACGEGLGTGLLRRWGAAAVIGVDISAETIKAANERRSAADRNTVKFVCADAVTFLEEAKTRFDVIVSSETIEHLPDPRRFLELCKERLTPKGSLVVTCPNDRYYYGGGETMNPFHRTSYSFEAFREMAEAILGPGRWAFGTHLNGFALFPSTSAKLVARHYDDAFLRRRNMLGETIAVPVKSPQALTAENALFFVGVWGGLALNNTLGVAIPRSSDYRMPDVRSVSPDISIGVERRLALVHDDAVTTDEIASLTAALDGKYRVAAVQWTGDAAALADAVLAQGQFDNIHFETAGAFSALAAWVEAQAHSLTPEMAERWSQATLTMRRGATVEHGLCDMLDGQIGMIEGDTGGDPKADDLAVLWSTVLPAPDSGLDPDAEPAPVKMTKRIGVVIATAAHREKVESVIAPALTDSCLPRLGVGLLTEEGADLDGFDVVICPGQSPLARRTAERAIARGIPVILTADQPLSGLLAGAQAGLEMAEFDLPGLRHSLVQLYGDAALAARISVENRALAAHMSSAARGVGWTRSLLAAQQARANWGGRLRAAVVRLAAGRPDAAGVASGDLQAECRRLQAELLQRDQIMSQLAETLRKMTENRQG